MEIRLTNTKGTFDVTQFVPTVKWSGDYQQAARTLDAAVLSSPEDKSIPVIDCPLGASIQMIEGKDTLFDGFIFSRTKSTEASTLPFTCFDRGFFLKRNKVLKKYTARTPEAVTGELAGEFGIKVGSLATTGVKITRSFISGNDSLYDIICTMYNLASQTTKKKYHIGFRGALLYVTVKAPDDRTLVIQGKSNLIAASITDSVENMVNAVRIYDKDNNFVRSVQNDSLIKLYGRMQEIVKQTQKDDKSSEAQKLLDDNGVSQKITVDNLGNVANVTGGSAIVQEPYTGLYGLFYIDSDINEWKRGQYYNKLVLNYKAIMNEKEVGDLPNKDGKKTAGSDQQWQYINPPKAKD